MDIAVVLPQRRRIEDHQPAIHPERHWLTVLHARDVIIGAVDAHERILSVRANLAATDDLALRIERFDGGRRPD